MDQNKLMTVEESYVERRQLFKDIWDTAMHMDEKDGEILNKPKVIKTLRLNQVDKSAGRKKKQRIKNLRAVCKKILDFCDKQEADDIFYEQIATECHVPPPKPEMGLTKRRKLRVRKKVIRRSKSLFSPTREPTHARAIVSDGKEIFSINSKNKPTRKSSPMKLNRPLIMRKPYVLSNKIGSTAPSVTITPKFQSPGKPSNNSTLTRRVNKIKSNSKKKKRSGDRVAPLKIDVIDG